MRGAAGNSLEGAEDWVYSTSWLRGSAPDLGEKESCYWMESEKDGGRPWFYEVCAGVANRPAGKPVPCGEHWGVVSAYISILQYGFPPATEPFSKHIGAVLLEDS